MKIQTYTVYDPISEFPFQIQSPIPLKNRSYSFHPAYEESFDHIYKHTKKILLSQESIHNIQNKRLALGILLTHLAESDVLEFRQFSSLKLSHSFFKDKDLLAKFFFIIPKIIFATAREKKRLPRFRITQNEIGSIGPWIDLVIEAFSDMENLRQKILDKDQYDSTYHKINKEFQKWKLYSTSKDKLPARVIHYIFTVSATEPDKQKEWRPFFTESAGTLYMKHKIKSIEAVDLFWSILECIDHIESSNYHNDLTIAVIKWLKLKVEEWVDWHPQFLELSLDYRVLTPKKEAVAGLSSFWIKYNEESAKEAEERKELANSVAKRLAERKALKESGAKKAVASFSIVLPSPIHSPNQSSNKEEQGEEGEDK